MTGKLEGIADGANAFKEYDSVVKYLNVYDCFPGMGGTIGLGGAIGEPLRFGVLDKVSYDPAHGVYAAIGKVEMWGTVIEHERGYRSEYARVVEITETWLPHGLGFIRDRYKV